MAAGEAQATIPKFDAPRKPSDALQKSAALAGALVRGSPISCSSQSIDSVSSPSGFGIARAKASTVAARDSIQSAAGDASMASEGEEVSSPVREGRGTEQTSAPACVPRALHAVTVRPADLRVRLRDSARSAAPSSTVSSGSEDSPVPVGRGRVVDSANESKTKGAHDADAPDVGDAAPSATEKAAQRLVSKREQSEVSRGNIFSKYAAGATLVSDDDDDADDDDADDADFEEAADVGDSPVDEEPELDSADDSDAGDEDDGGAYSGDSDSDDGGNFVRRSTRKRAPVERTSPQASEEYDGPRRRSARARAAPKSYNEAEIEARLDDAILSSDSEARARRKRRRRKRVVDGSASDTEESSVDDSGSVERPFFVVGSILASRSLPVEAWNLLSANRNTRFVANGTVFSAASAKVPQSPGGQQKTMESLVSGAPLSPVASGRSGLASAGLASPEKALHSGLPFSSWPARLFAKYDAADENEAADYQERFLVKWRNLSHLHCTWETEADLEANGGASFRGKLSRFRKKQSNMRVISDQFFEPGAVVPERIIGWRDNEVGDAADSDAEGETAEGGAGASAGGAGSGRRKFRGSEFDKSREYLVKWEALSYAECTWELARDIDDDDLIREHLAEVSNVDVSPAARKARIKAAGLKANTRPGLARMKSLLPKDPPKGNDETQQLRKYQHEAVIWMLMAWQKGRSVILADEMGLGKTIQSMTFLRMLRDPMGKNQPFLVVAPLSTLPHWQREADAWTKFKTVVYHGPADARHTIRNYELCHHRGNGIGISKTTPLGGSGAAGDFKVDVIVTTYEVLLKDAELLAPVSWAALVVDEAHRMKNTKSKLVECLAKFTFGTSLLLTGTPLQNSAEELWTLLNFIDDEAFPDVDDFMEKYDGLKTAEAVNKLRPVLKGYMLRRKKEDVEKAIPPREETIVTVELTRLQKRLYKTVYEQNFSALQRATGAQQKMMNMFMELRKVCNHAYLLTGVEMSVRNGPLSKELRVREQGVTDDDPAVVAAAASELPEESALDAEQRVNEYLIRASGKMVLLDKLLPKLKAQGSKVLIFSQMTKCLDLIEDFLILRGFPSERIDGEVSSRKRQPAIDRFSDPRSDSFIFLLSTKAGGVGINLTAADTVIIFDSDWNPQNDIQAQARCHRIGQTKPVSVYRLITNHTYEQEMFERSSMKLGLEQAVLAGGGGVATASKPKAPSKKQMERLLRYGAYDLLNRDGEVDEREKAFVEADIDAILDAAKRVKIQGGSGGIDSAFSKATFAAEGSAEIDLDDPDFWTKHDFGFEAGDEADVVLGPRKRKQVDYGESLRKQALWAPDSDQDGGGAGAGAGGVDSEFSEDDDDDAASVSNSPARTGPVKHRRVLPGDKRVKGADNCGRTARDNLRNLLFGLGWGRWQEAMAPDCCPRFKEAEVIKLSNGLVGLAALAVHQGHVGKNKDKFKPTADGIVAQCQEAIGKLATKYTICEILSTGFDSVSDIPMLVPPSFLDASFTIRIAANGESYLEGLDRLRVLSIAAKRYGAVDDAGLMADGDAGGPVPQWPLVASRRPAPWWSKEYEKLMLKAAMTVGIWRSAWLDKFEELVAEKEGVVLHRPTKDESTQATPKKATAQASKPESTSEAKQDDAAAAEAGDEDKGTGGKDAADGDADANPSSGAGDEDTKAAAVGSAPGDADGKAKAAASDPEKSQPEASASSGAADANGAAATSSEKADKGPEHPKTPWPTRIALRKRLSEFARAAAPLVDSMGPLKFDPPHVFSGRQLTAHAKACGKQLTLSTERGVVATQADIAAQLRRPKVWSLKSLRAVVKVMLSHGVPIEPAQEPEKKEAGSGDANGEAQGSADVAAKTEKDTGDAAAAPPAKKPRVEEEGASNSSAAGADAKDGDAASAAAAGAGAGVPDGAAAAGTPAKPDASASSSATEPSSAPTTGDSKQDAGASRSQGTSTQGTFTWAEFIKLTGTKKHTEQQHERLCKEILALSERAQQKKEEEKAKQAAQKRSIASLMTAADKDGADKDGAAPADATATPAKPSETEGKQDSPRADEGEGKPASTAPATGGAGGPSTTPSGPASAGARDGSAALSPLAAAFAGKLQASSGAKAAESGAAKSASASDSEPQSKEAMEERVAKDGALLVQSKIGDRTLRKAVKHCEAMRVLRTAVREQAKEKETLEAVVRRTFKMRKTRNQKTFAQWTVDLDLLLVEGTLARGLDEWHGCTEAEPSGKPDAKKTDSAAANVSGGASSAAATSPDAKAPAPADSATKADASDAPAEAAASGAAQAKPSDDGAAAATTDAGVKRPREAAEGTPADGGEKAAGGAGGAAAGGEGATDKEASAKTSGAADSATLPNGHPPPPVGLTIRRILDIVACIERVKQMDRNPPIAAAGAAAPTKGNAFSVLLGGKAKAAKRKQSGIAGFLSKDAAPGTSPAASKAASTDGQPAKRARVSGALSRDSVTLPLRIGVKTVHDFGVLDPRPGFHNAQYVFPVGLHTSCKFTDYTSDAFTEDGKEPKCTYHSYIRVSKDNKPMFVVVNENDEDNPCKGPKMTTPWSIVVTRVNEKMKSVLGDKATLKHPRVSGPRLYGYAGVLPYLESDPELSTLAPKYVPTAQRAAAKKGKAGGAAATPSPKRAKTPRTPAEGDDAVDGGDSQSDDGESSTRSPKRARTGDNEAAAGTPASTAGAGAGAGAVAAGESGDAAEGASQSSAAAGGAGAGAGSAGEA